MTPNRRQTDRARLTIAVKKRVGETASLCQAGDISRDGMLLAKAYEGLYRDLPRCWLEFTLPGSDVTIEARAQVVRQQRHERFHLLAVRFATLAPSHRRLIERFVEMPAMQSAVMSARTWMLNE